MRLSKDIMPISHSFYQAVGVTTADPVDNTVVAVEKPSSVASGSSSTWTNPLTKVLSGWFGGGGSKQPQGDKTPQAAALDASANPVLKVSSDGNASLQV